MKLIAVVGLTVAFLVGCGGSDNPSAVPTTTTITWPSSPTVAVDTHGIRACELAVLVRVRLDSGSYFDGTSDGEFRFKRDYVRLLSEAGKSTREVIRSVEQGGDLQNIVAELAAVCD